MKIKSVIVLLLVTMLFGCNKLKHIPFDYSYHKSIDVPGGPIPSFTESFSFVLPTNIDSIMQANGTKPSLLESAKLSALTLNITNPSGQNFSFINSISVYVVDGSNEYLIAHKYNVSTTSPTLDMDIDNLELKPYLTAQNMTLKTIGTTNAGTTVDMTIYYDLKIHFEANLLAVF